MQAATIRTRLLRILVLALAVLLTLLGVAAAGQISAYRNASATADNARLEITLQGLIHELQKERGLTTGYVGGVKEFTGEERAIVLGSVRAGQFQGDDYSRFMEIRAGRLAALDGFPRSATDAQQRRLDAAMTTPDAERALAYEDTAVKGGGKLKWNDIPPMQWWDAMTSANNGLRDVQVSLGTGVENRASALEGTAQRDLLLFLLLALGTVAAPGALALDCVRSVSAPLAELAQQAREVAGESSPRPSITDVLRASLAEVEEYRRVTLRRVEPAHLTGALARKCGIEVRLGEAPAAGVVARVLIPVNLLTEATATPKQAAAAEPATVPAPRREPGQTQLVSVAAVARPEQPQKKGASVARTRNGLVKRPQRSAISEAVSETDRPSRPAPGERRGPGGVGAGGRCAGAGVRCAGAVWRPRVSSWLVAQFPAPLRGRGELDQRAYGARGEGCACEGEGWGAAENAKSPRCPRGAQGVSSTGTGPHATEVDVGALDQPLLWMHGPSGTGLRFSVN
ncbi:nitrate- and nitrite sensing domain-containing protein [Streptomyces hyaluromycini]|uniref:nitrate- and nitrite sensing domain-containing protein n=1 Tax=Streptomyces hyaluromycini TaxID=1377993 RepID=UPI000B5C6C01|nr:nitrate- and nitrite sensing domain-containing protein [Streptomyces hyaluromycini]